MTMKVRAICGGKHGARFALGCTCLLFLCAVGSISLTWFTVKGEDCALAESFEFAHNLRRFCVSVNGLGAGLDSINTNETAANSTSNSSDSTSVVIAEQCEYYVDLDQDKDLQGSDQYMEAALGLVVVACLLYLISLGTSSFVLLDPGRDGGALKGICAAVCAGAASLFLLAAALHVMDSPPYDEKNWTDFNDIFHCEAFSRSQDMGMQVATIAGAVGVLYGAFFILVSLCCRRSSAAVQDQPAVLHEGGEGRGGREMLYDMQPSKRGGAMANDEEPPFCTGHLGTGVALGLNVLFFVLSLVSVLLEWVIIEGKECDSLETYEYEIMLREYCSSVIRPGNDTLSDCGSFADFNDEDELEGTDDYMQAALALVGFACFLFLIGLVFAAISMRFPGRAWTKTRNIVALSFCTLGALIAGLSTLRVTDSPPYAATHWEDILPCDSVSSSWGMGFQLVAGVAVLGFLGGVIFLCVYGCCAAEPILNQDEPKVSAVHAYPAHLATDSADASSHGGGSPGLYDEEAFGVNSAGADAGPETDGEAGDRRVTLNVPEEEDEESTQVKPLSQQLREQEARDMVERDRRMRERFAEEEAARDRAERRRTARQRHFEELKREERRKLEQKIRIVQARKQSHNKHLAYFGEDG